MSALLALGLDVPAWLFFLWARSGAQRVWLGGIGQIMLALAFAGGAALVALLGIIASGVDASDREAPVEPSIRLGVVALGASIASIVLFFAIGLDGKGLLD